jgi:hypothetical protein
MMAGNHIHVAVCIPSGDTWKAKTAKCVALMFSYFALHRVKGAASQKMSLISMQSSMLSFSRELSTKKALQAEATHVLFIDSDMTFPMNTANRLLEHKKDFVAANCTTRQKPVETVAHSLKGERLDSRGKHGLEEVQHVGLAVTLVRTSVIKALRPPLFLMDWIPELQAYCGEDVYFCQKLVAKEVKLFVDHDLSVNVHHVGSYSYGHDDLEEADSDG